MSSPHGRFVGKTIFISGAARGQGRSHALLVAREGGNVVAMDVCRDIDVLQYPLATADDLARTVELVELEGGAIVARHGDVRVQGDIDSVVEEGLRAFGSIDGVIANAGVWEFGLKLWEESEDGWSTVIDIVLSGTWRLLKAVSPQLISQHSGAIVITGSICSVEPAQGYCSYIAAKHGVLGLMRAAALELASHNVRVNAVAPGPVDTPIIHNPKAYKFFETPDRAAALRSMAAYGALPGRSSLPVSTVSEAVAWLLSDASENVTGIVLPIDCGHLLQPGFNPEPQLKGDGPDAERHWPPDEAPV